MNTPAWTPGMDTVTSMAAHPSMQRKTTEELWEGIARIDHALTDAYTLDTTTDDATTEWTAYVDGLRTQRRAYVRALEWRGAT